MPEEPIYENLGIHPVLTIKDPTETYTIGYIDFPVVAKGATTVTRSIRVRNTASGSAAQNCTLVARTFWYANTGYVPIDNLWIKAKCTTYGDTEFYSVDGVVGKAVGYASGIADIPYNDYADIDIKIEIPTSCEGRIYHVYLEIIYDYY